jgi:hypothetical protein
MPGVSSVFPRGIPQWNSAFHHHLYKVVESGSGKPGQFYEEDKIKQRLRDNTADARLVARVERLLDWAFKTSNRYS